MLAGGPETCNLYDLVIQGSGDCGGFRGTTYCDPMDVNSTGLPTRLTGMNSGSAGSGLRLLANQGPSNQFGYFLIGSTRSEPGVALGNGRLCLSDSGGAIIGRYNHQGSRNSTGRFDGSGIFQKLVGTSSSGIGFDVPLSTPFSGGGTLSGGVRANFQLWHREPNGQSNFSNGLGVVF